jgi:hypothetical protein
LTDRVRTLREEVRFVVFADEKRSGRLREEFRAPPGVRKSPDHQSEWLECATDLVGKIDAHAHQLRPGGEQRAEQLAVHALDRDLTIPAGANDLANPRASFWSVVLSCIDSAVLACRASRQTTGKPSFFSSCQCQLDNGPISNPTRTTPGDFAV